MNYKCPVSFKVFIAVIVFLVLIIITALLFSQYGVDKKYSIILGFFMFVGLSFAAVGIYAGIVYKPEENKLKLLNKIGLAGSLVIYLVTIAFMGVTAFIMIS